MAGKLGYQERKSAPFRGVFFSHKDTKVQRSQRKKEKRVVVSNLSLINHDKITYNTPLDSPFVFFSSFVFFV